MKKLIVICVLLTIIGSGGYYFWQQNTHTQDSIKTNNTSTVSNAVSVDVMQIQPNNAVLQRQIPGRTNAFKVAEIRPQVSGIIIDRLFIEGSYVNQGQQLYLIDPAPYQAAYNKALADLKKAKANEKAVLVKRKRLQELVHSKSVSQQEFDDVQANLDLASADIAIATAAVSSAKINLNYTRVNAPIAGRIGKSEFTRGALVTMNQSQALAKITQLDPMYVDMTLSSNELMRIRPLLNDNTDLKVKLILDYDNSTYDHPGKLQFADVSVDQSTGSVQMRTLFPNPDGKLLPGMFVRTYLQLTIVDAFLIPQKATQRQPDGSLTVWVVTADNQAQSKIVMVDRTLGNQWLVRKGLQSGDLIVVSGMLKLKNDVAVKIDKTINADKATISK